jgi:Ca2+-binding EF-hand superfamily protein
MEVRAALRVLGFDAPDDEVQELLEKFNQGSA